MKFRRRTPIPHASFLCLGMSIVAYGVDGTWSSPNGGAWSSSLNWAGGVVATGVDAVADFSTIDLGANTTVSLGFVATAGTLRFGDIPPSYQWTVSNTGGSLVMDVNSGTPKIQVLGNTVARIQVPIAGSEGLEVVSAGSGTLGGEVILSGNNSFTGGLKIAGGKVTLASGLAAGAAANTITVSAAVNPNISNQLAITGGLAFFNKVVIAAGASPLAGRGAVQQTGTGTATVDGTITIEGAVASGGHFAGGSATGSELIIGGVITSSVPVVQGGGRVSYRSGGSGYTSLVVNGVALNGANNGIAPNATLTVGDSINGTFALGNFTQTLAGLQLGTGAGNANGTVVINGTGRNLTITGNLTTAGQGAHSIFGPGALAFGANTPNFTVADGASANDLTISSGITGTAGFRKLGSGTMVLSGNIANTGAVAVVDGTLRGTPVFAGPLVVENNGILAAGTLTSVGSVSAPALTLSGGAGIRMKVGTNGDAINAGALNVAGPTTIGIQQLGGALANGIYPILRYTGANPDLNPITLLAFGRATATLVDTGSAIALNITGNDKALWQGTNGPAWGGIGSWRLQSNLASTNYIENDEVVFGDDPASTTVTIGADVFPSRVQFANHETNYHLTGIAGIAGFSDLVKSGAAAVRISTVNSYVGATTIEGGTLELDRSTGDLPATSGVSVAPGAVFKLSQLNSDMTFSRPISGAGNVILDPNAGGVAGARTVTLSGINSGFSGVWQISPNSSGGGGLGGGTVRWQQPSLGAVGTGEIRVDKGGQFWASGNTFSNLLRVSGTGYEEALGGPSISPVATTTNGVYVGVGNPVFTYDGLGALRLDNNAVLTGNVHMQGDTKIGIVNGTGTIAGDITAGVNDTLVIGGNTGSGTSTVILAGNNVYGRTIVNGGSGNGNGIHVLQIGNAGTQGTLGNGDVVLQGEGAATARIVFRRSDGYTLAPGQRITASASGSANLARTQVVVSTTGAGLTLSNHEIDLSDGVFGGGLYVGGVNGVSGSTGARLNITGASVVDVGRFYLGDQFEISGTVTQSGNSTVKVLNHMRVGSVSGARSLYQLNGGTLDFIPVAVSPMFPYDSDYFTDDGGLWLGVEGNGTFHQTGGTLATNFLALSYFRATASGDPPLRENDVYQLDGGTLLLKHKYGIISRRTHAAINLNGGTIRAATGVSPSLDSDAITIQAGGVTLDTNGPNTFNLYGPLLGVGSVNLTGGGTLRLSNSGVLLTGGSLGGASIQIAPGSTLHVARDRVPEYGLIDVWTGAVSGAGTFIKEKTGYLVLAGNASSFTGTTTVLGGRLKVPANFGSPNTEIRDGASFGGEPTTTKLKLGETTGGHLYFDPQTPGALGVSQLIIRGNSTFDFEAIPTSPGPWTVLNYGSRDLAGTFNLADANEYRPGSVQVVDTGSSVTVNLIGAKTLTWTGPSSNSWDSFGDTINWTDGATPQKFHHGDTVMFGDSTPETSTVIDVNRVRPWKTTINADQRTYRLSGLNGGISGPGGVEKSGTATAFLGSENTYSGQTILSGGILSVDPLSIGDGSPTNAVVFNGGTLFTTGLMDLGAFRPVIVNASGGTMTANGMFSSGGFTISGPLRGDGPLTFTSSTLQGSTHAIAGDLSNFHGTLIVKAFGPTSYGTTLRLTNGVASSAQTISVLPSVLGFDGGTSALDLANASAGSGTTLELHSSIIDGVTQGSSLLNSTGTASWDGPIKLFGNGQTQLGVTGRMVINGTIASGGDFSGKFVLRGNGNGVLNGTITLPGATVEKLAGSTWEINSQNNQWVSTYLSAGVLRLGADRALPPAASLTVANYDTTLDLNGFDQTVTGLRVSGGRVTNSGPAIATLTVHQDTDTTLEGVFSGLLGIVKTGSGNMTFRQNNDFSGPLVISGGTVTANYFFSTTTSGPLGASNVAGRTVTISPGATLALQVSDVFGSGQNNETTMPLLRVNQATLSSTVYNALGPVELNGGTLIHSNSETAGGKQGYQFRGSITVGGIVPSVISSSSGKANHLSANSIFDVGNATNDPGADLIVSNPLHNQSSDFNSAAGGLTKTGPGTMELGAINTFTGRTTVQGGTLLVTGSLAASSLTTVEMGGTLAGTGTVGPLKSTGGTISPGASPGTLRVGNLEFAGGRFFVELFGTNADQFDRLLVTGSATITGDTALDISLGYVPSNGDSFLLVSNDGVDPIAGSALFTVGGLPRPSGSPFVVSGLQSGQYFELNYAAGDGNDVVLSTIPEPGSAALLLCGGSIVYARRRRVI
jgi:fibronectin-binding autotransporter adhesin